MLTKTLSVQVEITQYGFFFVRADLEARGSNPTRVSDWPSIGSIPDGFYVYTQVRDGFVGLEIQVYDSREVSEHPQSDLIGIVRFEVDEAELYVGNFEGTSDTFAQPIALPVEGEYEARIYTNNEAAAGSEGYRIQLAPA